ncbi:hypothetical protein [Bacillus marinisedimentorum]|uniref:hypothetical protein n=1 Tax=Bacillus marinisedimentorum TaxID=1821260 RepID=UPI000871DEAD|nr:hypothetical protein [Bacillus marinisedimentorum]
MNLKVLTQLQNNYAELKRVYKKYLEWLAPQIDNLIDEYKANYAKTRNLFSSKFQSHPRIPDTLASLYLGFIQYLKFLTSQEIIDPDTMKGLKISMVQTLTKPGEEHSYDVRSEKPTSEFLFAVSSLLSLNIHLSFLYNE